MALWAKYSTTWYLDPKVTELSAEAELLYARAIAYCKEALTDGVVARSALAPLGFKLRRPDRCADEIVSAGLWLPVDRGFTFPPETWERWQGTKADVEQRREAEAERKRQWRSRRDKNGTTPGHDEGQPQDSGVRDTDVLACACAKPEPEPELEIETPLKPPLETRHPAAHRIQGGGAPPDPPAGDVIRNLDRLEATVTDLSERFRLEDDE